MPKITFDPANRSEGCARGSLGEGHARARPPVMCERLLYRVKDAAETISVSRSMHYELMASGQIESVRVGSRRLIPQGALVVFVEDLKRQGSQPATETGVVP